MINSPTALATLAPPSPAAGAGGTWPRLPRRGLKRPRGLWKARRQPDPTTTTSSLRVAQHHQLLQTPGGSRGDTKSSSSGRGSDTDREMDGESGGELEEDGDDMSQDSGSSKRQRRDSGSSGSVELWAGAVYYLDAEASLGMAAPAETPPAPSVVVGGVLPPGTNMNDDAVRSRSRTLISDMVTTSIAEGVAPSRAAAKESYEYKDWEGIKETLTRASELCEGDDPLGSIPLLRAVIHECHRFLLRFPDPSDFFFRPVGQLHREGSGSPDSLALAEERPWHERHERRWRRSISPDSDVGQSQNRRYHDSPTALHAVLGIALFFFGNIIAQNPSLALSREPTTPTPYWRAALDVFNAGENLPCQTRGADPTDDDGNEHNWRLAIVWGRTLVALAHDATKHSPPPSPATARPSPRAAPYPPRYPPRSPLAAIVAMHTAGGGLAHARATPAELLTLAADQFTRGIFHMPHTPIASRGPHALFTIASEVLAVAERLDGAETRRRWAVWADAVFVQMCSKVDVVGAWRACVDVARGRCSLVIGRARADGLEDRLEGGDLGVLLSKEAEEARAGLFMAISLFDRARGFVSTAESLETALVDTKPWLAEALLSLANLTTDQNAREASYARAQAEAGEAVALSPGSRHRRFRSQGMDVRMDESS
ncbi:hypothetical protein BC827DRAFT_541589 [Russula dissimulans]|nr:hypothetical protein BC827DRAFT_541589 [Russula dissimulans]